MKKVILLILSLSVLFSFASCREYSPAEAKEIYLNNADVFQQVVDICVKYQVPYPLSNWNVDYTPNENWNTLDKKQLSKQEKKVLEKCVDAGCRAVYSNLDNDNKSKYINFEIPANFYAGQGIIVFLSDINELYSGLDKVTVEEFVQKLNEPYRKFEIEKLDENTYYYCAWDEDPNYWHPQESAGSSSQPEDIIEDPSDIPPCLYGKIKNFVPFRTK